MEMIRFGVVATHVRICNMLRRLRLTITRTLLSRIHFVRIGNRLQCLQDLSTISLCRKKLQHAKPSVLIKLNL